MEELKEKTADLADHVEDLANTFYRLTLVNATQKASNIISSAIVMLLICSLGFLVLLFMGVALAWWLGNIVNSRAGGFLLAAAFFLIVLLFLSILGKKTIFPFIRDLIIRKMYD
ncbi:MAG TPA: phage holin family protein [Chitinophagaceae bacterium]|nr:phage holin family protein [Chitinophagaceae bacterium]